MRTLPQSAFSLIHYVELARDGWQEKLDERCVHGVLWQQQAPMSVQKIKQDVSKRLGPGLKTQHLLQILEKLERKGDVVKLQRNEYKLSVEASKQTDKDVEEFNALEQVVKERFCAALRAACPGLDPVSVWQSFIEHFLIPLVSSEGAKAYELLVRRDSRTLATGVSGMDSFLERIPIQYIERTNLFISIFLSRDDAEVTRFFLSYLDAYFLLSAHGLPPRVINELAEMSKGSIEFIVFVDTNFIYSILGLHSNPSNEAANDLMELVESIPSNVCIQFVVRGSTIEETLGSIAYHRRLLGNPAYPPNVAKAATFTEISGVTRTFFERAAASGGNISAADYFVPYENGLVQMLEEKGVKVFPEGDQKDHVGYEQTLAVNEDVESQLRYERDKYGEKAKTEKQIIHDVVLWHFVRDHRDLMPLTEGWTSD